MSFTYRSVNSGLCRPGSGAALIPLAYVRRLERAPKSEEPHAVPLPVALPLFASGIGALGLLARRGKRKAAAVAG